LGPADGQILGLGPCAPFMLHGVPSQERARELAAAFHAALYVTWSR
jgi:hypothetical protein